MTAKINQLGDLPDELTVIEQCCRQALAKISAPNFKNTFQKIRHNWRTRHQLSQLSEAQLKDVGLTKIDVYQERQKPLWR